MASVEVVTPPNIGSQKGKKPMARPAPSSIFQVYTQKKPIPKPERARMTKVTKGKTAASLGSTMNSGSKKEASLLNIYSGKKPSGLIQK